MIDTKLIHTTFKEHFGTTGRLFTAPGRINLIGEHTDYNLGYVLPGAINRHITIEIRPNGLRSFRVYARDLNEFAEFHTGDRKTTKHWANYVLGVVMEFERRCFGVAPFDAVIAGDIPAGSGLSSSAALESAFAVAINTLGRFGLASLELAQIGQGAEQNYAGVQCGIMDQFVSLHGAAKHVILLDCQSLKHELVPFHLPGYRLVLLDTRVKHSLASSEYNARREECEQGVSILQNQFSEIHSLRDATRAQLDSCRDGMSEKVYNRCVYVLEENQRVLNAVRHLKQANLTGLGAELYASHAGLSRLFEVSCPELDFLVDQARSGHAVIGARMMGGGFGGCTINLVSAGAVDEWVEKTGRNFAERFGHAPLVHEFEISDGAREIDLASR